MEEYHNLPPVGTPKQPRYRGISYTTPINAAKEAVEVIVLADLLCGPGRMRKVGNEWTARCPLPDHEDHSPSFTVNPEKNVWFCHGCLHGGDVVELYRLYHGHDQRDAHVAAANLLLEFGHDIPQRPPAWFRKQERQKKVRDLAEEARVEVMARRLWRYVFRPIVEEIEDIDERNRVAERLWPKVEMKAKQILAQRRGNQ